MVVVTVETGRSVILRDTHTYDMKVSSCHIAVERNADADALALYLDANAHDMH